MSILTLSREEYRDKVFACWLGKNIGGTLGAPYEGRKEVLHLSFYDPVPAAAAANDDLDLQLVWLQMLEGTGIDPALPHFAHYWNRYASAYPWDEYGFFMRNYHRGLRPPVAGCFENFYVDNMGSPIRSEIWACLYPGDPDSAARMAWKDSAVDHAGGEGTCGEMFWAAVEAAAFVESDPLTLIRIGLNVIPLASQIARSIREAVHCHQAGLDWLSARNCITTWFAAEHACHAVPNHGFTILGWLYGQDFGDKLCKAVNCGYDTDCTGATLGSLLGILGGSAGIPAPWLQPVGDRIVLHRFTRFLNAPRNVSELTQRTIMLAEKTATSDRGFGDNTSLPADLHTRLFRNTQSRAMLKLDLDMGVELCAGKEVEFHYNGEPVLRPGITREIEVTVGGKAIDGIELTVPPTWNCTKLSSSRFALSSPSPIADRNAIAVRIAGVGAVDFAMLGPGAATGYPAGSNVDKCPGCRARVEQCICSPAARQTRDSTQ